MNSFQGIFYIQKIQFIDFTSTELFSYLDFHNRYVVSVSFFGTWVLKLDRVFYKEKVKLNLVLDPEMKIKIICTFVRNKLFFLT